MEEKFFVRGVVYQLYRNYGAVDPISNERLSQLDPISDERLPQLEHDILLFKELGVNTLFVCMHHTTAFSATAIAHSRRFQRQCKGTHKGYALARRGRDICLNGEAVKALTVRAYVTKEY